MEREKPPLLTRHQVESIRLRRQLAADLAETLVPFETEEDYGHYVDDRQAVKLADYMIDKHIYSEDK